MSKIYVDMSEIYVDMSEIYVGEFDFRNEG